jgi:hypothetical protein
MKVIDQRCFNHALREAAAPCPECQRVFCRECIIEHADRMICAGCLQRTLVAGQNRRARSALAFLSLQFASAFIVLWLFFYSLGVAIFRLPTSFHEGTLWTERLWKIDESK